MKAQGLILFQSKRLPPKLEALCSRETGNSFGHEVDELPRRGRWKSQRMQYPTSLVRRSSFEFLVLRGLALLL